jgi:RHS repeat-associated protein
VVPEETRHLHPDHLGSPRLITDETGNTVTQPVYFPFGEEATPPSTDEVLKFTGHERDPLGAGTTDDLDYMHARYYSPHLGRFMSVDLASGNPRIPQSWNRYGYVLGNPLRFTDPFGLFPCPGFQEIECQESVTVTADLPDLGGFNSFLAFSALFFTQGGNAALNARAGRSLDFMSSVLQEFGANNRASMGLPREKTDFERDLDFFLEQIGILLPSGSAVSRLKLQKSLSSTELLAQEGRIIAGQGVGAALRQAERLASQYGGKPSDWVKKTSTARTAADGTRMQVRWFENIKTGQRVEHKTIIGN